MQGRPSVRHSLWGQKRLLFLVGLDARSKGVVTRAEKICGSSSESRRAFSQSGNVSTDPASQSRESLPWPDPGLELGQIWDELEEAPKHS